MSCTKTPTILDQNPLETFKSLSFTISINGKVKNVTCGDPTDPHPRPLVKPFIRPPAIYPLGTQFSFSMLDALQNSKAIHETVNLKFF